MKPKTFNIIFFTVLALCAVFTIAHFIYDVNAYQHCSIIYFIAKELW
ncbi:MAG: hypothetical protein IJ331_07040 [Ruminococcus sp.]|nr:hypothetical protein [Ruminococcus sp.]